MESNERSVDSDITQNEVTDTSVTDDNFTDDIPEAPNRATETVTEPFATDTRCYPQWTRRPPDRLICQDTV